MRIYHLVVMAAMAAAPAAAQTPVFGLGGSGGAADGVGYDQVLDEGIALPKRAVFDLVGAGVSCIDNAGQVRTECTVAGGAGETNTASNQGTGIGVFDGKVGVDLEFRSLVSANGILTVTLDAVNKEIDFQVVESAMNLANMGGTLGTGQAAAGFTLDAEQVAGSRVDVFGLTEDAAPAAAAWVLVETNLGGAWNKVQLGNLPGSGGSFASLSDTTITTPAAGDFARYSGTAWVNLPLLAAHISDITSATAAWLVAGCSLNVAVVGDGSSGFKCSDTGPTNITGLTDDVFPTAPVNANEFTLAVDRTSGQLGWFINGEGSARFVPRNLSDLQDVTAKGGNATVVATESGAFTPGNAVTKDASGNLVDSGSAPGGGGGGAYDPTSDAEIARYWTKWEWPCDTGLTEESLGPGWEVAGMTLNFNSCSGTGNAAFNAPGGALWMFPATNGAPARLYEGANSTIPNLGAQADFSYITRFQMLAVGSIASIRLHIGFGDSTARDAEDADAGDWAGISYENNAAASNCGDTLAKTDANWQLTSCNNGVCTAVNSTMPVAHSDYLWMRVKAATAGNIQVCVDTADAATWPAGQCNTFTANLPDSSLTAPFFNVTKCDAVPTGTTAGLVVDYTATVWEAAR